MGQWSKLSAQEKAQIIKFAIDNGVSDINSIRDTYNVYADGGSIHIDKNKKGTFTAAATKHGKSVQEFASQVLAHKENYSPAMVKKANFARNTAHWGAEGLRLDDEYNTNQYNQQLDRFTGLGFKGQQASDLAAYEAGKNLQYDAGQLPFEVVATPAKKHVIFDNGIKNVHYAPHTAPVQESAESKIAAGVIGAPLLATAGTSIAAPAIPKIVNFLNSPIMQSIDALLTAGDIATSGLDAYYYFKDKYLWNRAGYKNYFDFRYNGLNSSTDYIPMAFDLLSAASAFRLGKDIHKGVQLYKNSPKLFEDARNFVKQMHLEDFDAAGKGVIERYSQPFVPYSKRTPESLRSSLLNSLDNLTYEKTLNPFKYGNVHFKNLKDVFSLSNWKKFDNLLSNFNAYFQRVDNVIRVNPKTFFIRNNTNTEKNFGALLAHEVEHGVFNNLEYPYEAKEFISRWGKSDNIGIGYNWHKSLNEFNSEIASEKYKLGKKHYKDFTKEEKEKFTNSLQNEFFNDPNKADQLLFMMHKHLSTGGPLYPFSFQKNPYLKVPAVRYGEGGKKSTPSKAQIVRSAWDNENPFNKGLLKNGMYEQYDDPNGEGRDVGPGLLVGATIPDKKLYTRQELDDAAYAFGMEGLASIGKAYNEKYGIEKFPTPFDTVSVAPKLLLLDTRYQNGRLPIANWPSLYQSIADGNWAEALKNSRSTYIKDGVKYYDNDRVRRRAESIFPGMFDVIFTPNSKEFPKVTNRKKSKK